jgi:general secretion pathway protein A
VNIERNDQKLLSVIVAGQPEIAARLNQPELRQLKQRIALRCELKALSLMETTAYVAGRVAAAGGSGAKVFTREAVTLIHEHSHGLPRMINVIADNALLGGFAAGERPVTSRIVREVCADFQLPNETVAAPPAPAPPAADSGPASVLSLDLPPGRKRQAQAGRADTPAPEEPRKVAEAAARPRRFSLFGL